MRFSVIGAVCLLGSAVFAAPARAAVEDKPVVVFETTMGTITVELDPAKAPISVANFLKYVDSGFYDGVVFHRVIPGFMIQTGGFKEADDLLSEKLKDAFGPIQNESDNGLSNVAGTLAMARTPNPNSATSQFFINLVDNSRLDHYAGGYAVFGKVIGGMDVVEAIAKVDTTTKRISTGARQEACPIKPITIKSAKRKAKA